jgi:hypothetical protein
MRERQPHHPYGLDQIPFDGAAPVIIGTIGDARSSSATADVIDKDIDPAKSSDGGLNQRCSFIGLADIGAV